MSPTTARHLLAYVLPVHNEAAGLHAFHDALVTATNKRPDLDFEFVYVDDGSRDASLDLLLDLRTADERVTVISLARNFGHQIAVTAGLDAAAGRDAVIIMDTDLQDPPEVSLQLIETWESGVDVAYAQRRTRQDSPFKKGTAHLFYWLLTRLASVDIPRNVGDFRLMDRKVVAEVIRYREHDRFLRGIVSHVGFRQEAVPFDRDPRYAGLLVVPAAHDAEARRRRDPRLLDVPPAADLAAGHGDLPAERARRALRRLRPGLRARRGPCPAGRSSRSVCSCSAACSC